MRFSGDTGRIPERVVEAVRVIRDDGLGHADVLRRFYDADERRAAAVLLSTKPDLSCRRSGVFLHRLLVTMTFIMAAMYIFDVPLLGVFLAGTCMMIHRRQVWGYHAMVALAIWAMVVAITGLGGQEAQGVGAIITSLVLTAGMIAAGALAVYLRRAMYPYLGLFGIRTDGDGNPVLLHALAETERDAAES